MHQRIAIGWASRAGYFPIPGCTVLPGTRSPHAIRLDFSRILARFYIFAGIIEQAVSHVR